MIQLIALLLAGLLFGFLLRHKRLHWVSGLLMVVIWLLLFLLGVETGSNSQIMDHLGSLGLLSAVLALAAITGSVLMAALLWRFVNAKGIKQIGAAPSGEPLPAVDKTLASATSPHPLRGSLVITAFFVAGVLLSRFGLMSHIQWPEKLSFYVLCVLLFLVGVTVGNDTRTLKQFKQLNPRLFLLPLATAIGTFAAVAVVGWLTSLRVSESLAIGSGFAYYSLSSILITQYKGVYLGTVALLTNVLRELFTLLGAPLQVRWFGPLAPIASGGATTMDTTLPVIVKCCGSEYTVLAVFHSMVLDFSVPFLVTFFCGW